MVEEDGVFGVDGVVGVVGLVGLAWKKKLNVTPKEKKTSKTKFYKLPAAKVSSTKVQLFYKKNHAKELKVLLHQ